MGTSVSIPEHVEQQISKRSGKHKQKYARTSGQIEQTMINSLYFDQSEVRNKERVQTTRQIPCQHFPNNSIAQGVNTQFFGQDSAPANNLPLDSVHLKEKEGINLSYNLVTFQKVILCSFLLFFHFFFNKIIQFFLLKFIPKSV